MLLTITYTGQSATDLGYLLHKNPKRVHSFELNFGSAYVFYPEATFERCTAALLLDINPVDLAKDFRNSSSEEPLFEYVNDRPYVASSFLSVAIANVFGTAMSGRSKERPELVDQQLSLQATITMLPASGGEDVIRRLFEPLGYKVATQGYLLDQKFIEWGSSRYFTVTIESNCRLVDLLNHIYVLMPVLDVKKHYWIGHDEIEKLLNRGSGWLSTHPEREMITNRYLKRKRSLVNQALSRLLAAEETVKEDTVQDEVGESAAEGKMERDLNLNERRLGTVAAVLRNLSAKRVIDLGCGEGRLLSILLKDREFIRIAGMDVSYRVLEKAKERLRLEELPPFQRERIKLFQGSLIYRDHRIQGYDAVTVIEVIEHLDLNRLVAFEKVLFEYTHPPAVVITTPNREYNVKYLNLNKEFRHNDHRFEWTREEFKTWATAIAGRYGYQVDFLNIGDEDPEYGAPTQMGVFTR
ncbi:MAG TPA: 3' terminal RNA ribose 2'-O-methyltransferase Hen1 [Bacillota bacterium]|nr:3' terminal RNA ribose 2'-O-methyltransferase Hen1 [Bacillota bacterium]HOL10974.1 3' terminal RNA ribose 2'-O-methyltransferase Hen1 [Bacillota bacterium]HPO98044.1 3' terminal RNA ribose 2'-O-methyltransferase Hen1 [Bacillota bacterium]